MADWMVPETDSTSVGEMVVQWVNEKENKWEHWWGAMMAVSLAGWKALNSVGSMVARKVHNLAARWVVR